MKYFVITVDKNFVPPVPIGWYGKIDRKSWKGRKAHEMPKHLLFQAEPHMQMVFTDVVTFPCFMVSSMVRDVIQQYCPSVRFAQIILYDKKQKKSMAYYLPFLGTVENSGTAGRIMLERDRLEDLVIAETALADRTLVIMRMDLVESILRRDAVGIGVEEAEIIEGGSI